MAAVAWNFARREVPFSRHFGWGAGLGLIATGHADVSARPCMSPPVVLSLKTPRGFDAARS